MIEIRMHRLFQTVSRYQWIVLLACYAGGLFDGLDSSLFTIAVKPAVSQLLHTQNTTSVGPIGSTITALFLLGWTAGGIIFGLLGDKIGRVRALTISILIYAIFTGLCGLAQSWQQLAFFRFMTALGIGGELIVGTTLLAESWPEQYRSKAVGVLSSAYQMGYLLVGAISLGLGSFLNHFDWRILFFIGVLPALLTMGIRHHVHEPEKWTQQKKEQPTSSAFSDIFKPPFLLRTLAASLFTGALLVAYWASSFWVPMWIQSLLGHTQHAMQTSSFVMLLIGLFGMIGAISSGFLADWIGRRWTVVLANLGYLAATLGLFLLHRHYEPSLVYWACGLGYFIGLNIAICYVFVPELFPTRLRGTGTGFCFNMGRIAAAAGSQFSGALIGILGGSIAMAAVSISFVLLLGAVVVWAAPETRNQKLLD
jgi:MFS family permease